MALPVYRKGDEEEGSSQPGRLTGNLPGWRPAAGKIEASAEALRVSHHPTSFPPDEIYNSI
jgi:hypothetical protein